jgi:hypothetical protein
MLRTCSILGERSGPERNCRPRIPFFALRIREVLLQLPRYTGGKSAAQFSNELTRRSGDFGGRFRGLSKNYWWWDFSRIGNGATKPITPPLLQILFCPQNQVLRAFRERGKGLSSAPASRCLPVVSPVQQRGQTFQRQLRCSHPILPVHLREAPERENILTPRPIAEKDPVEHFS